MCMWYICLYYSWTFRTHQWNAWVHVHVHKIYDDTKILKWLWLSLSLSLSLSSNVLSLRARSLHSLPDPWQPGTFPYTFSLAMPLAQSPNSATSAGTPTFSRGIVIPQGALKLCPDKDHSAVSANWKWPHLPGVTTNASLVGNCPMEPRPLEEEVGQLNTKQVKWLWGVMYKIMNMLCMHAALFWILYSRKFLQDSVFMGGQSLPFRGLDLCTIQLSHFCT